MSLYCKAIPFPPGKRTNADGSGHVGKGHIEAENTVRGMHGFLFHARMDDAE
jgi:hypothetical protein